LLPNRFPRKGNEKGLLKKKQNEILRSQEPSLLLHLLTKLINKSRQSIRHGVSIIQDIMIGESDEMKTH